MSVITTEQEIYKLVELTNELRVKLEIEKKAEQETPVTISFESKAELAAALISGRSFDTPKGCSLHYDDSGTGSPFRYVIFNNSKKYGQPIDRYWDNLEGLIETTPVVPWYLAKNFMPVECYVSDIDENPGYGRPVSVITKYCAGRNCKFIGNLGVDWKYATPTGN
jgi:hypothetical protein